MDGVVDGFGGGRGGRQFIGGVAGVDRPGGDRRGRERMARDGASDADAAKRGDSIDVDIATETALIGSSATIASSVGLRGDCDGHWSCRR